MPDHTGVDGHPRPPHATTEADLTAAFAAIAAHLAPGIAVLMGDATTETFEPGTETGGTDGRGVRYIEWTWDRDPDDHHVQTEYAFALRTADGTVSTVHETHHFGLFRTKPCSTGCETRASHRAGSPNAQTTTANPEPCSFQH